MSIHSQDHSIFFRVPLELRQKIYQNCQPFYMGYDMRLADKDATDVTKLLPFGQKTTPALLRSCKRIREEAEQWMKQHIHIQYSTSGFEILDIRTAGIAQFEWVRKLTLESHDFDYKPNMAFRLAEHIIDHAPLLQTLEIRWGSLEYSEFWNGIVPFEDVVRPWLPIVVRAIYKGLRVLRLDGARREWATAFRRVVELENPGVKLDIRYEENGA